MLPASQSAATVPKLVLCMKWGRVYGPAYVNNLYGMVQRNVTGPFRLICFTEDKTGVRPEVECLPLPDLGCEIPKDVPGKWPKVALWNKELYGLSGVALFIDLDSVIIDNIDGYFTYGDPQDVITARNWVKPLSRSGQTSVFRFPIGGHSYMLENLHKDPAGVSRKHRFEQNYVTHGIRGGVKFWPSAWTKHFGVHSMGPWPMRLVRVPVMPGGAKIVTFPGHPKPPHAIEGRWRDSHPVRTRKEHFAWVWNAIRTGDKKWHRHLGSYILPTPWVAEHWRP